MSKGKIKVIELFAGVGGFRLGLETASDRFETVMANQWEPGKKSQPAAECYAFNFNYNADENIPGKYTNNNNTHFWNEDIGVLVEKMKSNPGDLTIPKHDLLVGGFPCFVAGTKITMRSGKKRIEDVEVGDEVLTHTGEYHRVLKTFVNPRGTRKMFRLDINGRILFCTGNHRFLARNVNTISDWISADNLDTTYEVFLPKHNIWHKISMISPSAFEPKYVYNLEVEKDNSYVTEDIAAHNCQDYSVAKPNTQSHGLQGKKGVLWWSIYEILKQRRPSMVLLENVDRLLKSPSKQRGRDFAVILATLSDLGYTVEWQVVNAGDYGFPQRRRRIFILAKQNDNNPLIHLFNNGTLVKAFPVEISEESEGKIIGEPWEITNDFNKGEKNSPFKNRGILRNREYITGRIKAIYSGKQTVLGDILEPEPVSPEFYTEPEKWRYIKGAKDEERTSSTGFNYRYKEGAVPFPDPLDKPSRTILTSEGGAAASRTKHCIEPKPGVYRRLTPVELERLDGFPDDWTKFVGKDVEMKSNQRAFMMGNALVVGVIERIARELVKEI